MSPNGSAMRPVWSGGHMALGVSLFWQGELEPALTHFRRGFEMFVPDMQFPDWPGSHPAVQCQFYLALISWMLGYPDRSLDELRAAVRSAETLGHPLTLAHTLCSVAFVHIFRHEPPVAADCAGRALRICEEQRIARYHGIALCEEVRSDLASAERAGSAGKHCSSRARGDKNSRDRDLILRGEGADLFLRGR